MTKPFEQMTGPEFLHLYAAFFAAAAVAAAVARWALRSPAGDRDTPAPELSPYEIAYLAGGHKLAADAALVNLVGRGDLVVNAAGQVFAERALGPGAHLLELAVAPAHQGRVGEWSISAARRSARAGLTETHARLVYLGLVVADGQAWAAQVVSSFPFFALLTLGLIRLWFGLAQGKPVVVLLFYCAVTALVGIRLLANRPLRSRRGDRVLKGFRRENAALKNVGSPGAPGPDLALAVGLFGAAVLAGGPLADLYTALVPPSGSSGGDGGGGDGGGGGGGGGCGG